MNKWWRKEDNYLHGSRCQPVSPGWGESSGGERRKGNRKVSAGDSDCRCYKKRPQTRGVKALSPILIAVLRYLSKCLGWRGNQNTIMPLSWLDTIMFLLPGIQSKQNNLSGTYVSVCACASTFVFCGLSCRVHGKVEGLHTVCVSKWGTPRQS